MSWPVTQACGKYLKFTTFWEKIWEKSRAGKAGKWVGRRKVDVKVGEEKRSWMVEQTGEEAYKKTWERWTCLAERNRKEEMITL